MVHNNCGDLQAEILKKEFLKKKYLVEQYGEGADKSYDDGKNEVTLVGFIKDGFVHSLKSSLYSIGDLLTPDSWEIGKSINIASAEYEREYTERQTRKLAEIINKRPGDVPYSVGVYDGAKGAEGFGEAVAMLTELGVSELAAAKALQGLSSAKNTLQGFKRAEKVVPKAKPVIYRINKQTGKPWNADEINTVINNSADDALKNSNKDHTELNNAIKEYNEKWFKGEIMEFDDFEDLFDLFNQTK